MLPRMRRVSKHWLQRPRRLRPTCLRWALSAVLGPYVYAHDFATIQKEAAKHVAYGKVDDNHVPARSSENKEEGINPPHAREKQVDSTLHSENLAALQAQLKQGNNSESQRTFDICLKYATTTHVKCNGQSFCPPSTIIVSDKNLCLYLQAANHVLVRLLFLSLHYHYFLMFTGRYNHHTGRADLRGTQESRSDNVGARTVLLFTQRPLLTFFSQGHGGIGAV